MVEIQCMFMRLNMGVRFDSAFLMKNSIDGFLKLPMSVANLSLPQNLANIVDEVVNKFKGIDKSNPKVIKELLQALKDHDKLLSQEVSLK